MLNKKYGQKPHTNYQDGIKRYPLKINKCK